MEESFKLYGSTAFESLSPEKNRLLFEDGSKEALNQIFEGNMSLVTYVIEKNFYMSKDKEELFQVGCEGLWKSILRFDIKLGNEFSTYAIPMIIGNIRRFLRDTKTVIRIPRSIKDLSYKIQKLQEEYSRKNNSLLSSERLSELLHVPIKDINDAIICMYDNNSIDEVVFNNSKDGGEIYLKDTISDDYDIDEEVWYYEMLNIINEMVEHLSKRNKEIIKYYYGIGYPKKTQMEIADIINISQAQVSRVALKFKRTFMKVINYDEIKHEKTLKKERQDIKDSRTIYEKLSNFDKSMIDKNLLLIDKEKKECLLKLYPIDYKKEKIKLTREEKAKAKSVLKEVIFNLALQEVELEESTYDEDKTTARNINDIEKKKNKSDRKKDNMINTDNKNDTLIDELIQFFNGKSKEQILQALLLLKPDNKRIMELRFGLNGNPVTSNEEIAKMFSVSVNKIYSVVAYSKNRLRKILEKDDNNKFKLQKEQKYVGKQVQEMDKIKKDFPGMNIEQLLFASSKLSSRPREVFILSYGLKDKMPLTNKQIMETLNLSEKNVSQQLYVARKKIREILSDNVKEDFNKLCTSEPEKNNIMFTNASTHINKVTEMIRSGVYDFGKPYISGNITVKVESSVGDCLLATVDSERKEVIKKKGICKKCYIYRIIAMNKEGKIINQSILLKDKNMKKFYKVIKTDKNGKFIFNDVFSNEIACYGISNEDRIEVFENNQSSVNDKRTISLDEQIQNLYKEAVEFLDKKDVYSAEKNFNKLLRMSDDNHICYNVNMYLGRIYKRKKKFVVAEKYFKDALEFEQDYFTMVQLGVVLSLQGKYDEAIYYFDMSGKISGAKSNHLIEKAKTLKLMGQVQNAIEILDDCISHNERNYWAHIEKAKILFEQNSFENATFELEKCNGIKPNCNNHMVIMGKIEYLKGNKDQAINIFNDCVENDIKNDVMYSIIEIGYFFHEMDLEDLAYYYYNKTPMFPKWVNLTTNEINAHFEKHRLNSNQEKMHSVLNVDISLEKLNELIEKMNKTGTRQLYDIYQIHWPNVGYMQIDDNKKVQEDYLTIFTLPFTKKIMMCYPDFKFEGKILNDPAEIDSLVKQDEKVMQIENQSELESRNVKMVNTKQYNDDNILQGVKIEDVKKIFSEVPAKYTDMDEDIMPVYVDDAKDTEVTLVPKKINVPIFDNFNEHKEAFRTLINLLSNPTEQVVLLLSLGYVQDTKYSNDQISTLLGIKTDEVNDIIEQGLTNIMGVSAFTINGVESARKCLKAKTY